MRPFILATLLLMNMVSEGQEKPNYYQIPDTPVQYTPETVAARLVDGVGFRYYWATEGLREIDLQFRPSKEARSSYETLQHIYGLSSVLLNAVSGRPTSAQAQDSLSFNELRKRTLENIQRASEILKQPGSHLENFDMVFQGRGQRTRFPFWNLVNGPIADALWHIGQVVTFRRSSGNPLPKGVNVLTGTKTN